VGRYSGVIEVGAYEYVEMLDPQKKILRLKQDPKTSTAQNVTSNVPSLLSLKQEVS